MRGLYPRIVFEGILSWVSVIHSNTKYSILYFYKIFQCAMYVLRRKVSGFCMDCENIMKLNSRKPGTINPNTTYTNQQRVLESIEPDSCHRTAPLIRRSPPSHITDAPCSAFRPTTTTIVFGAWPLLNRRSWRRCMQSRFDRERKGIRSFQRAITIWPESSDVRTPSVKIQRQTGGTR